MTNPMRRTMPVVVAGALGMGASIAWAAEPSTQDLLNKVDQLQAKVAALEVQKAGSTTEQNATIEQALRDAQARSQLLAAEGAGLTLSTAGGATTMHFMAGVQLRRVVNVQQDGKHGDETNTDTGFEITRARLAIGGQAFSPDIDYFVQWDAGDLTGGVALLDAVATWKFGGSDQLRIKAGQFKDLITHEGLVSWDNGLAAASSMTNELLGTPSGAAGRVQGAGIIFGAPADALRLEVDYTDGLGSANTTFQNQSGPALGLTTINWGLSGRVDYKVSGDWNNYWTMSARDTKDQLFVIGAGGDVFQGDNFTAVKFAGDGQFEVSNLSIYAAFIGDYLKLRNTPNEGNAFSYGVVAQVGYALSQEWEVFGRFDWSHFDHAQINDQKNFFEITGGVNYYLVQGAAGSGAKVTVDLTYLPNGAPVDLAYQDILGGSDNGQFILRAQLQLALK